MKCVLPLVLGLVATVQAESPSRPPSPPVVQRASGDNGASRGDLLLVLGAEGESQYGRLFGEWAATWEEAARLGRWRLHVVGDLVGDASQNQAKTGLRARLSAAVNEPTEPLWIVFLGHGTFDGRTAKFNLLGDDVSAAELSEWLAPLSRPVAIVQCASASGPFIDALSGPQRVVIAATKSGQEVNFARFGGFLAAAAADPAADLDKDRQVSLLEAFLRAARRTDEFYTGENRLATEHPLLDDDGDGRGTRAAAFAGVRPVRQSDSGATLDGYIAHQWILIPNAAEFELPPEARRRRDELEREVLALRDRKGEFSEDEYYAELERLLVALARVSLGREE